MSKKKVKWKFSEGKWKNTCNKCCNDCEKNNKECTQHCTNVFSYETFCNGCKYD